MSNELRVGNAHSSSSVAFCAAAGMVAGPVTSPNNGTGANATVIVSGGKIAASSDAGAAATALTGTCALIITDSSGRVTFNSRTKSTGPCSLTIGADGNVCIVDLVTSAVVWCNNVRNAGICAPYSLRTTPDGILIETDCAGNVVWSTAGQGGELAGMRPGCELALWLRHT